MTYLLYALSSVCLFQCTLSLSITNITSPILLTPLFAESDFSSYYFDMTYYIHPSTSQTYLWYQILLNEYNDTYPYLRSLKSDIFTPYFEQYNNKNYKLPFTIESGDISYNSGIITPMMCTSPLTMDILSCWSTHGQINCKLYNSQKNKFGKVIPIGIPESNFPLSVLCFDDSYFVTYWEIIKHEQSSNITWNFYGTILDLNGNIVYDNAVWKVLDFSDDYYVISLGFYLEKGGNSFNPQLINKNATALFRWYIQTSAADANKTYINDIYGYYSNINDQKFPIYFYNNETIVRNGQYSAANPISNDILDWTDDCCYIEMYRAFPNNDVYARITDIYGYKINIEGYDNTDDYIILLRNSTYVDIVDLPILSFSNLSRHYFMLYGGQNVVVCAVFYLALDTNEKQYQLSEAGQYNTAYSNPSVTVYNLPKTNYLFYSWMTGDYSQIYGQTWQINETYTNKYV
eukprot:369716_1